MRGVKDLTGQTFGELTVVCLGERHKRRWKWVVVCSCGTKKQVFGNALTRGLTKSCGCKRGGEPNVEIGQRFKQLLVVTRVKSSKEGDSRWLCRCDCGKEKELLGRNLVRGYTGSCGCYGKIPREITAFNMTLGHYKTSARVRNLEWGLSNAYFKELIEADCYYCGKCPDMTEKLRKVILPYLHNGIDRKNNCSGYVNENVVPCCSICNRAKGSMSHDEFLVFVRQVVNHQNQKSTISTLVRSTSA